MHRLRKNLKILAGLLLVCICILGFCYYFSGRTSHPRIFNDSTEENGGKSTNSRLTYSASEKIDEIRIGQRGKSKYADNVEKKSLGSLQQKIVQILGDSEASRSRMLLESKRGNNYCYLLGVEPPAPSEVNSMRKAISKIQAHVSQEDKEKLDKYIGEMIKRYDPFGIEGKKAIYIVIPEDFENRKISGVTFSADDFEELKKVFDPNLDVVQFPFRNVKPYVRSDMKMLSRFSSLIK